MTDSQAAAAEGLNLTEVAARLRRSRAWVRTQIERGRIKAMRDPWTNSLVVLPGELERINQRFEPYVPPAGG